MKMVKKLTRCKLVEFEIKGVTTVCLPLLMCLDVDSV